jgi:phosphopantothenoylcysteine decarboxylase/phosphopantothenate--cysteine ligase
MQLKGKRILLGVTGSIAAYKIPLLARLLVKEGAEVKVVMTDSAADFVTSPTLSVITGHPVYTSFYNDHGQWQNHVELGLWADLIVIAPASANTMAKMAYGFCDNLLLAVYLSARCPVMIVPAMDADMFSHQATQENVQKLKLYGHEIIGPANGALASGLKGWGRMEEPELIFGRIILHFSRTKDFRHKKVLITCGPTREAIDPVRFLSNRSSGKMGLALALELEHRGAAVTLIAGPGVPKPENFTGKFIAVESAYDMHQACMDHFPDAHITIMAAAVADFTIAHPEKEKIKKSKEGSLTLRLSPTHDILAEMGKKKKKKQFLAGFALETNNEWKNAVNKLEKKNLDIIILNSMNDAGAGFESDTNKITLIDRNKKKISFPLKSKTEVAKDIADYIKKHHHA